jgi:hypothetical protein
MKSLLTLSFMLAALCAYCQDVIKINGTDPINCKIISVTKDEVIFTRNGSQRKASTAYVDYYKFNEKVKEKMVPDSIPFVEVSKDTVRGPEQMNSKVSDTVKGPDKEPPMNSQTETANHLIDGGRNFRSGLTLTLLGSVCAGLSPLFVTNKEITKQYTVSGTTISYTYIETNYTGAYIMAGTGVLLNIIGIVQLFNAANEIENAGKQMKYQGGLSFNGSLQGFQVAYRF